MTTSIDYVVADVTNILYLPAGCACGGTWVNRVKRTIRRADCGSCPLFVRPSVHSHTIGRSSHEASVSMRRTPRTCTE